MNPLDLISFMEQHQSNPVIQRPIRVESFPTSWQRRPPSQICHQGRQFILTLPTDAAGENAAADAMHKAEIAAVNFIF